MSKQYRKSALLGLTAALAAAGSAQAAEEAVTLKEVVVTATKTEKTLADVPADVTVVTQEEMKRKNYTNVSEALESLPGVMSYSGTGIAPGPPASPVVNLRGFHGAMRTMIMVNGQPISPFMYAASLVHWSAVPADSIERIEVVRGPFSALYGGDAVGGIVNIITKTPEAFEGTVRSGYGSNNTFKEHASIGGKPLANLSAFAAYDFKKTDNYVGDFNILKAAAPTPDMLAGAKAVTGVTPQPYRTGGTGYLVGDKGEYDYNEHTFTLNLKATPTDQSALKANILYSFYEIDPSGSSSYLRDSTGGEVRSGLVSFQDGGGTQYLDVTSGGFMTSGAEKATGVYSLEYTNKLSHDLSLKLSAGLTDFSNDKVMFPIGGATDAGGPGVFQEAPSTIWTGEIQTDYKASDWVLLTTGLSLRRDEGTFRSYMASNWRDFDSLSALLQTIEPESSRYGTYIQAELTPVDKLAIYLGGRYDWWESEAVRQTTAATENLASQDQNAFSPKASLVYNPLDDTTLRLSAGKAFRVPNFFEQYQPLTGSGTTYVPNPNLAPETTWSWEGGIEQNFCAGRATLGFTYFEHYTSDFIDSRTSADPSDPTKIIAQRDNFGEVEVRGVEISGRRKITDHLSGFANYTYTDAEITENPNYPKYVGNRPRYVPEHMFNVGFDWKFAPFTAGIVTHYRSKMQQTNANDTVNWEVYGVQDEIPFVTDVTLGYDFLQNWNFTLTVSNLFDSEYYLWNQAPGTAAFGMLTVKF